MPSDRSPHTAIPWHLDQRLAATLCRNRGLRELQRRSITTAVVVTVGVTAAAIMAWIPLPAPGRTPHTHTPASPRMLVEALTMLIVAGAWMFALLPVALYRQRVLLHHCGACGHDLRLAGVITTCPACNEPFVPPPTDPAERLNIRQHVLDAGRRRDTPRPPKKRSARVIVPRDLWQVLACKISVVVAALIASITIDTSGFLQIHVPTWATHVGLALGIYIFALFFFRNIAFAKRLARGHCGFCNYDLNPLPSATCCPECGQPIEPGTNRAPPTKPLPPTSPTQAP